MSNGENGQNQKRVIRRKKKRGEGVVGIMRRG